MPVLLLNDALEVTSGLKNAAIKVVMITFMIRKQHHPRIAAVMSLLAQVRLRQRARAGWCI